MKLANVIRSFTNGTFAKPWVALWSMTIAIAISSQCIADTIGFDLTGMEIRSLDDPEGVDALFSSLGPGSYNITGVEVTNFAFESFSPSWRSDVIVGVLGTGGEGEWSWIPAATSDSPGVFGPVTAEFGGTTGISFGGPFTILSGESLVVAVYDGFGDALFPEGVVNSGTLTVTYSLVPEPATVLVWTGVASLALLRRRKPRRFQNAPV